MPLFESSTPGQAYKRVMLKSLKVYSEGKDIAQADNKKWI